MIVYTVDKKMKMTKGSQLQLKLHNILFYAVFIGLLVLLAYGSKIYKFEADWTAGNRNTLTQASQKLLGRLEQPLKLIAYIPDDPALHEELKLVISKYQRFKKNTTLEFVNPDLQPAKAKSAGIIYTGQVAVHLGNKHEIIEAIDEQTILQALHRLSRDKDRVITFITGHGERDPHSPQSTGLSMLTDNLTRLGFKIQTHHLVSTQSVPTNNDILVLAAAKTDLLVGELKLIQDYVKQGGKLLWLHDPDSSQTLMPLADQLGLLVYQGTVIDANQELQQLLGIDNAAVVPVLEYTKSAITKGIETQTLFPFSTMIAEDFDVKGKLDMIWEYHVFLSSLETTWLENGDMVKVLSFNPEEDERQGPIPLAVSLTRTLANPEQVIPPQNNSDNTESTKNSDKQNAVIASSDTDGTIREQRIIVIGDSDFLANAFIGYGANLELAKNIFNWLGQDDTLLNIPSQTAQDTRLEISDTLLISLSFFFLILLPLGLIIVGTLIWLRRKKS